MTLKKKLFIAIPIVLIVTLILAAAVFMHNKAFRVARIIEAENENYLWVTEDEGPTLIIEEWLCDLREVNTGDKVLLLCDSAVLLSYPGQNTVYYCKKLEAGTREDIPQVHIQGLEELDWKIK